MGVEANITMEKFPKQGPHLNRRVHVCFHYDTGHTIDGRVIRNDAEEPYRTIILLVDGRAVLATECQYTTVD